MTHSGLPPARLSPYNVPVLRPFLFLVCLALSPLAPAEYQSFKRDTRSGGLFSVMTPQDRIDAWFFNASESRIVVLDEGDADKRYGSLARAMEEEGCDAGINGGYFAADNESSPIGLVRHRGVRISPLSTGSFTVAGVLYDTGRELKLERSNKLSTAGEHMQEAIQGGPFLVDKGKAVRGLNNSRRARRSFVATDDKGRWCIATCSSITLYELAQWLSEGKALGDFKVRTALNLDGGSSSSFWVRSPGIRRPGLKAVRNYVGVSPRPAR